MSLFEFNKTYKPFHYPNLVERTKIHESSHWHEDEASLQEDVRQWNDGSLSKEEKNMITHILRLFTQSDVAVGQSYIDNFLPKFKNNEVRCMLASFCAREGVHQRAYALLNDTLGLPESEYHAFLEYTEMAEKWEFMTEPQGNSYSDTGVGLARLAMTEGVSLFASFAMLLNFQRFGKMKGMCEIVEWSIRDETMHVEGNAELFRILCDEHPRIVNNEFKSRIYSMAEQIVGLEDAFIDLAYEMGEPEGMKSVDLKEYIRYIMNRRLIQLGLKPIWTEIDRLPKTMDWLDWVIAGDTHKNFFEGRVTNYSKSGMTGSFDDFYKSLDKNQG